MNTHFQNPPFPRTTQAAEGMLRRRWSVAEVEALVVAGIIQGDERLELIGGEVVPMSPKGSAHETLRIALNDIWITRKQPWLRIAPETTLRLGEDTFFEPDFIFYKATDGVAKLVPSQVLLAVEIADSSLDYDLGRKARLYAVHGIRELWVVNATTLVTHIHCEPGLEGYGKVAAVGPDSLLVPDFAPELALKLGELQLI